MSDIKLTDSPSLKSIIPLKSLGPIAFGMHPSEVRRAMNEKEKYGGWMGGNLSSCLCYRGLLLQFDALAADLAPPEDSRLCEIDYNLRERDDYTLFGKMAGSWVRNELLDHFAKNSIHVIKREPAYALVLPEIGLELDFGSYDRLDFLSMSDEPIVIT